MLTPNAKTTAEHNEAISWGRVSGLGSISQQNYKTKQAGMLTHCLSTRNAQVMAERDEALRVIEEWDARCQQLEGEAEVLQAEIQRQELELAAGKADAETRGAAVTSLEAMLTNLTKAHAQGRYAGRRWPHIFLVELPVTACAIPLDHQSNVQTTAACIASPVWRHSCKKSIATGHGAKVSKFISTQIASVSSAAMLQFCERAWSSGAYAACIAKLAAGP